MFFLGSVTLSPVDTRYKEFDNGSGGRVGVLIVKPDPDLLYVASTLAAFAVKFVGDLDLTTTENLV